MKKMFSVFSIITVLITTTNTTINACWPCCSDQSAKVFDLAHNFRWFQRGVLAGMGKPSSHEDIEELVARNVGLIVTLIANEYIEGEFFSGELDSELFSGLAIATLHLPISANNPPTLDQVETFLAAVEATRARGKATVIHCELGISRTGVIAACFFLATKRYSVKKALKIISKGIKERCRILSDDQKIFIENYYQYLHNQSFVMPLTSLHASREPFNDVVTGNTSADRLCNQIDKTFELDPAPIGTLQKLPAASEPLQ